MIKKIDRNLFSVQHERFVLQVHVDTDPTIRSYSSGFKYAVNFYTWTPTGWQMLIALPPVSGEPTDENVMEIINDTINHLGLEYFEMIALLSH